jgi:putative molybdopterin biosynthesis protein
MKTIKEARKILFRQFPSQGLLATETVSSPDAVDRVLAKPITARISSPENHLAAMDGVAVKAESTFGASETRPKALTVGENTFYVNTGNVLPKNTNAVIMIENVHEIGKDQIEIEAPVFPWQHVRKVGEDIVATELLFPRNHVITPYCLGALLSGGIFTVSVKTKPKVLIIPTGSELVDWKGTAPEDLKPGQIFETNSYVLGKLVESSGGCYIRNELIPDDMNQIRQVVLDATQNDFDIILIGGGSSAGSKDYSKEIITQLGQVLVHGVTMMPGKPLIIGKINEKAIFGIPGYPVSAILSFEQFVYPLICRMLGKPEKEPETVQVVPTRKIASKLGVEEFLRVKIGLVGDKMVATSLPRGAGSITSLTEADAIIRIPNHIEGIKDQESVTAELLRPLSTVKDTIVVVGSHDNTLDVLADEIKAHHSRLSLSSSHVGSMGGLMAIKRGVCHLAGSHLLDPKDGSYNISYIKRYLPDVRVKQVNLVFRDQGLIVPSKNPKNIQGIEDLIREDVTFINRQPGSGTRILLDFRLNALQIPQDQICGYQNEEYTHMAVAVAVLSGTVDVGLGIYAAALALGLDFIPVVTEQYDLIIPEHHFESENVQKLLEIINSNPFKSRIEAMGGYSTKQTGKLLF